MKHLNQFITEYIIKKKLDKPIDSEDHYEYFPKTKKELIENIKELLSTGETNLNCIDTSAITDMSHLFETYANSENINFDVSRWDVSNVETMVGIFFNCKKFNCNLSNWNLSNVKKAAYMFYNCEEFNQDLSNWDVSNIKDMSHMFGNCKKFEGKGLDKWNISNVEYMIRMFIGCDNFTGETIENWKIKKSCSKFEFLLDCKKLKINPKWNTK